MQAADLQFYSPIEAEDGFFSGLLGPVPTCPTPAGSPAGSDNRQGRLAPHFAHEVGWAVSPVWW